MEVIIIPFAKSFPSPSQQLTVKFLSRNRSVQADHSPACRRCLCVVLTLVGQDVCEDHLAHVTSCNVQIRAGSEQSVGRRSIRWVLEQRVDVLLEGRDTHMVKLTRLAWRMRLGAAARPDALRRLLLHQLQPVLAITHPCQRMRDAADVLPVPAGGTRCTALGKAHNEVDLLERIDRGAPGIACRRAVRRHRVGRFDAIQHPNHVEHMRGALEAHVVASHRARGTAAVVAPPRSAVGAVARGGGHCKGRTDEEGGAAHWFAALSCAV